MTSINQTRLALALGWLRTIHPPFSFAPILALALPWLQFSPSAAHAQFIYTTNAGGTNLTITGYNGAGGDVMIPPTINGLPISGIGINAFYNNSSVTSVMIPSNVIAIAGSPFRSCASLTNITVDVANPNYSSDIAGILFNKTQTRLMQYPGGKFGSYAIPNSVTNIGDHAFSYSANLTGVVIPNTVTIVGSSAFQGCIGMISVTISDSVVGIGSDAFQGCTSLTSATIPDSVTFIGNYAFSGCASLTNIMVDAANPNYSSDAGGVLFDKSQTTLIQCPGGKTGGYSMPNTVTSILGSAFLFCTNLTSVTIGNSVISIGSSAFYSCTSLASVMIPDSVTSIGSSAFSSCINLTNVTVGNNVVSVGSHAFHFCNSLISVTIPNSVTSIGSYAFSSCTSLTNVTVPNSVKTIESYAFSSCTNLTSLIIGNSVTSIGSSAFSSCVSLASVMIPDSVTSIGSSAFSSCISLTSVMIPGSVTNIGAFVFSSCTSLTNILVDAANPSYSSDPAGVLFNKAQTTLIQCPEGKAGDYTIPISVTNIGAFAFFFCESLVSVTIGNGVTSIGLLAFSRCTNLMSVYFVTNAPATEGGVFFNANNATVYYLPGTIGWGATFAGRPTALWLPQMQSADSTFGIHSNQFGFNIKWAPGQMFVVDASPTVTTPVWTPLQTNVLVDDHVYFTDSDWINHATRFYRIRSP